MVHEALARDPKLATTEHLANALAVGSLAFGWLQVYGRFLQLLL